MNKNHKKGIIYKIVVMYIISSYLLIVIYNHINRNLDNFN